MSRSRSRSRSLVLAGVCGALVIVGAACSGSDDGVKSVGTAVEGGCAPFDKADLPEGAPVVDMPTETKPVLVKTDLKVGDGAEVTATDTVIVNYIGVSCSTGKVFDSSWSRRQPAQFTLSDLIPGWSQGVVGMKPGGQRLVVIPPALAYGKKPPEGSGIAVDETLVFVIDLVSAGPSPATTTTAPATLESAKGKPCVAPNGVPAVDGKPDVPVPVGPPPTELKTEDLKVGTGPAVAAGDTVTVNYVGISCSTGKQFDSSWDRGKPATFGLDQVIPGWTKGIPGMQVGGQRLLVIPPDQAYGAEGRPEIAPDETLVFVVELVKIGK